jgi:hypothetical protein
VYPFCIWDIPGVGDGERERKRDGACERVRVERTGDVRQLAAGVACAAAACAVSGYLSRLSGRGLGDSATAAGGAGAGGAAAEAKASATAEAKADTACANAGGANAGGAGANAGGANAGGTGAGTGTGAGATEKSGCELKSCESTNAASASIKRGHAKSESAPLHVGSTTNTSIPSTRSPVFGSYV